MRILVILVLTVLLLASMVVSQPVYDDVIYDIDDIDDIERDPSPNELLEIEKEVDGFDSQEDVS